MFHHCVPHYLPATFICCAHKSSHQAQPGKKMRSEGDYTVHLFWGFIYLFIYLFVAFFVSALICMCVCGIPVGLQASITLYKFHQHIHNNSRWGSLPFTSKMYFCVYLIVSKAVISTRHSWRSENPNDHIY